MAVQYACKDENRRDEVRDNPAFNGIDYLHVVDLQAPDEDLRQRILLVRLIHPLPSGTTVDAADVKIAGGVRVRDITVQRVFLASDPSAADYVPGGFLPAGEDDGWLVVLTGSAGDYSTYRLDLNRDSDPFKPFDPVLAAVDFSFKVECSSGFDCKSGLDCPPETPAPAPPLDYLAKDYASFRQLMLDRLAVILPDWEDRTPADLGIALVELLAYAGDRLGYYQDAVANEAYLGTARKRISVRRHARLLDYRMHEGCNARVWAQVTSGAVVQLPAGTRLLTRASSDPGPMKEEKYTDAMSRSPKPEVFVTMHAQDLVPTHDEIDFYAWSDGRCCLPKGATRATLLDETGQNVQLRVGDVLIFEETRSPETGRTEDADPAHRHAVRLTKVLPEAPESRTGTSSSHDALTDERYVEIEWADADALPIPLCLQVETSDGGLEVGAVARGNIVLADHGRRIDSDEEEDLEVLGDPPRPIRLAESHITHAVPCECDTLLVTPAAEVAAQDPRDALPVATLKESGDDWTARRDLLDSDRFARHFVVEMDEERTAWIRFGDDVLGRQPPDGAVLKATYRVGNGSAGNIGINAIEHVVSDSADVTGVHNPLPAQGGIDPESMEEVRLDAPYAFRTQERAVTAEDYAAVAGQHPEVQKAQATRRWTGSWHTMFLTVDRVEGRDVSPTFEAELRAFMERFRMAGHDLEIDAPRFVPLDIAMTVCVEPGHFASDVLEALLEAFCNHDLPDGRRGFFHPDNFTFGQPVYLSAVIARAMEVPGVRWISFEETPEETNRFHRWGEDAHGELDDGQITVDRLEILRLDNDPNRPENGRIEFVMEGGR